MAWFEDVRYGARTLAKNYGFTIVAAVTLALGIGANATVFTLSNAMLFKGFPFDQNDRILYMLNRNATRARDFAGVSYPEFRDWRKATSLEGMAAVNGMRISLSDQSGLPEGFWGTQISSNGFKLIGQKPVAGRDFTPADEAAGAPPVAILTYGLWERRYGKDPTLIGRTIRINGAATTVIGVMPRGFIFPFNQDLWMSLVPTANSEKRETRDFIVFGRMAQGVTVKQVRAEMETIGRDLASAYPVTNHAWIPEVQTYNEFFVGPTVTSTFEAMLGAVGFVLLIACANVANLMLARNAERSREISIRIALGAGRWQIIRQLLVESVMLSALGGFLGWLIARWGVRAFDLATTPYGKPSWVDFSMDGRVFAYLVATSIGTGVLFGLAPALRLARLDVNSALRDGGRGASTGARGKHLSNLLVIAETALAVVLLAGAGLTIRSFLNIYRASLGVKASNILTMRLALPEAKYPRPDTQISFHERLRTRLEAIPGVRTVAIADFLPTGGSLSLPYELSGTEPVDVQRRPMLSALVISPNYFEAVDVPILAGRAFKDVDGVADSPVVIVNQRFAQKFWPGEDPLGKRLRLVEYGKPEPWLTVVGVVPNIVQNDVTPKEIDPLIYLPYRQRPEADMAIVARTQVAPGRLGTAFRREIQAMDSDLPIYNLWTLSERLERNYWFYRATGILFLIFAGIALLLASIGLNALIAHSVNQRMQEIGVRMAIGATASDILRMVFAQGLRPMAIGLGIGLAGALAVTRILKSALVEVSAADPTTFVTASLVLAVAAMLGCLIPARRAMRVDPVIALHHE
jgi:putative ABC transport system permease protein